MDTETIGIYFSRLPVQYNGRATNLTNFWYLFDNSLIERIFVYDSNSKGSKFVEMSKDKFRSMEFSEWHGEEAQVYKKSLTDWMIQRGSPSSDVTVVCISSSGNDIYVVMEENK